MADIPWRVTPQVSHQYDELTERLLAIQDQGGEWSDEYVDLLDQVKALPGYPQHYSEEHDTIRRVGVDTPRVGYTRELRLN